MKIKKNKKEQETPNLVKYGLLSNIIYLYKILFGFKKSTMVTCPLTVVLTVAKSIIVVAIPSIAVYAIETGVTAGQFITYVGGIILTYGILRVLQMIIQADYEQSSTVTRVYECVGRMIEKSFAIDYVNRESNKNQKLIGGANDSLSSNWVGVELVYKSVPEVAINFIGLLLYGGAILTVDIRILLVLILMLIFNVSLNAYARNYMNRTMEENTEIGRKEGYIRQKSVSPDSGKDVRIFHMEKWFGKLMLQYVQAGNRWQRRIEKRFYIPVASDTIFIAVRDGLAYVILIHLVLQGKMSLAMFTLMLGVVSGFSEWMFSIVNSITNLMNANIKVDYFRSVLDMKDTFKHKDGLGIPDESRYPLDIELRNVSFRYEDDVDKTEESQVLSNINIHIRPGEKIALVGNNGAGKTTLVKLLCGFYHPTEGEILINGISIEEYNIEEYFKLIGAVFQDTDDMAFSIVNIITAKDKNECDMERFWDAADKAGIKEKIMSLGKKEDTYISPIFDDEGIKLSGGEMQKLMLARCIYKDAPIMILDEPTSALDPIGESRMYEQYNNMTKNKTSIFISHRLASTRFCDRILFLENGRIAEQGSHTELLEKGGRYAKIYEIQSHYYKEDIQGDSSVDMEAAYE